MNLNAKAQAALQAVVEKFEAGDLSPVVEIAKLRLPTDAPAAKWTFSNRVLAYAQTGSIDCRGFRQWQTTGRHVTKGQHAGYILAPRIVTDRDSEEKKLAGWLAVAVFGYHQTEPDEDCPDASFDYQPIELPPLVDVAEQLGVTVRWTPTPEDRLGDCDTEGQRINIGTHDHKTFFHELAHAVHARIEDGLRGGQDAHQETVAEFTATVLMYLYGLGDRTGNCWRYVSQYAKEPIIAITKALGTVEQILGVLQQTQEAVNV